MIESLLTGAWRRITNEIARSPLMVILIASMWFISLYVFPTVTKNVVDVQKAQWNPQSFKIVTNTLVLPKPLPLVQIKPSITVGLDMRLKPNVVAGVGVIFNL